jgi:hypothetical protein
MRRPALPRPSAHPLTAVLLVAALVALLAGCGDSDEDATPSPTPSASASSSPTPTASPAPRDPLTGLALVRGPVVAVKVDNSVLARPYHRGLEQAAVVYQELVEGGATRFMAVFESARATREVGPIRSARESDLDILRAYGKPALAFSGAQSGVLAIVASAVRAGRLVDASYDRVPSLYRLGEFRRDARNFFAVPARLGESRGGSEPRDIGWVFGPPATGVPTRLARATFSPQATVSLRYDAGAAAWTVSQGGRVLPVTPANVVVQFVTVQRSRFHDVNGMNTPLTVTTGSGKAVVLRDGRRFSATWRRSGNGPTRLLAGPGRDVPLRPGKTLVLLVPKAGGLTFG